MGACALVCVFAHSFVFMRDLVCLYVCLCIFGSLGEAEAPRVFCVAVCFAKGILRREVKRFFQAAECLEAMECVLPSLGASVCLSVYLSVCLSD